MIFTWFIKKDKWECDWCNEEKEGRKNFYYKAVYGEYYNPNDPELGRMIKEKVCDCCWSRSMARDEIYS